MNRTLFLFMTEIILFEADYQDDLGQVVPGTAAISLNEIVKKLKVLGFSIQKNTSSRKITNI